MPTVLLGPLPVNPTILDSRDYAKIPFQGLPASDAFRGKGNTFALLAANTTQIVNAPQGAYRILVPLLGANEILRVFIAHWTGPHITAVSSGTGGLMRCTLATHGLNVGDKGVLVFMNWTGIDNTSYGNGPFTVANVVDTNNFETTIPFPIGGTAVITANFPNAMHDSYAPVDAPMGDNDANLYFTGPEPHDFIARIGGATTGSGGVGFGGPNNNKAAYPVGYIQVCFRHNSAAARDVHVMCIS